MISNMEKGLINMVMAKYILVDGKKESNMAKELSRRRMPKMNRSNILMAKKKKIEISSFIQKKNYPFIYQQNHEK